MCFNIIHQAVVDVAAVAAVAAVVAASLLNFNKKNFIPFFWVEVKVSRNGDIEFD